MCMQANRGKCRVTDVGFKKGDPRCIVPTGPGKFYASIGAAGKMLTELLQVMMHSFCARACQSDALSRRHL